MKTRVLFPPSGPHMHVAGMMSGRFHFLLLLIAAATALGNEHGQAVTRPSQPLLVPLITPTDGTIRIYLKPESSMFMGDDEGFLQRWLDDLVVVIPNISTEKATFKIGISNGVCTKFQVDDITTTREGTSVRITALGLSATCALHFSAQSIYIKSMSASGNVNATVGNGKLGGPIAFPESGQPPLPTGLEAAGCKCDIEVTKLHFDGGIMSSILEVLTPVIKGLLSPALGGIICQQLTDATKGPASKAIQNGSALIRKFLATKPVNPWVPAPLPEPKKDFANIGFNPGMVMVQKIMRVLDNPASTYNLNKIVDKYSLGSIHLKSGGAVLPVKKTVLLAGVGVINITIDDAVLGGLDTWSNLRLNTLDPQQVALGLGVNSFTGDISVKLEVEPAPGSKILHGGKLVEEFVVSLDLKQIATGAAVFAALNQTYLGTLSIDQLAAPGCLLPGIHSAMVPQSSLALPSIGTSLAPIGHNTLDKALDNLLDNLLAMTLTEFQPAVDAVVGHAASVTFRDKVNTGIQTALALGKFATTCPDPAPSYANMDATQVFYDIAVGLMVIILLIAILCPFVNKIQMRRAQKRELPLLSPGMGAVEAGVVDHSGTSLQTGAPGPSPDVSLNLYTPRTLNSDGTIEIERQRLARKYKSWDALAFHPRISTVWRWGLPLMDITVVCMMIASNCSIATSVNVALEGDMREAIHLPPVFGFSLVSSIKDMWDGKIYALALLILVFSGIWPYAKLATMQICWFAPTKWLSPGRRQWLLEFLDEWGKWSLVDAFVMVLFMVAFKFNLSATDAKVFPWLSGMFAEAGTTGKINVFVEAGLGFHVFLIATVGSLVVGHGMTACNRYALELGEYSPSAIPQAFAERTRLCNTLRPPGFWPGKIFAYGPIVAMGLCLTLVVFGLWIDVFSFTFEGLGGYVLGDEGRVRSYSVVSLGLAIPSAARDPNSAPIIWLQCVFLMFSAVAVVSYCVILIVLWCAPLSPRLQSHFFVACQTLSAWSGIDVFVVSIMAAVLEISTFVGFIIGHKCDPINDVLEKLHLDLPGSQTCFGIATELKSGFYILLVAAVLAAVMGRLMIKRCKSALCMDIDHVDSIVEANQ